MSSIETSVSALQMSAFAGKADMVTAPRRPKADITLQQSANPVGGVAAWPLRRVSSRPAIVVTGFLDPDRLTLSPTGCAHFTVASRRKGLSPSAFPHVLNLPNECYSLPA